MKRIQNEGASTCLELAALGADVRLDCAAGDTRGAEVLDGFAAVLGAAEEDRVGAGGGAEGKLVEGDALACVGR
jgi:hypothetical protein